MSAFVTGVQSSQELTHERNLVGSEAEAERFVHTMAGLGDRLGPLLLQLPPSFDVEGMGVLEDFLKLRWLGNRREFPEGHTHLKKERDEDLRWWSALVDSFLEEGKTVFAYANNHYQNHAPSTLERFLEIVRDRR